MEDVVLAMKKVSEYCDTFKGGCSGCIFNKSGHCIIQCEVPADIEYEMTISIK